MIEKPTFEFTRGRLLILAYADRSVLVFEWDAKAAQYGRCLAAGGFHERIGRGGGSEVKDVLRITIGALGGSLVDGIESALRELWREG